MITVARDGSGDFSSIQAAADALPEGSGEARIILVRAGEYRERRLFLLLHPADHTDGAPDSVDSDSRFPR